MNCKDLDAKTRMKNSEVDRQRRSQENRAQNKKPVDTDREKPQEAGANGKAQWRFVVHDKIWYWEREGPSGVIRKGAFTSYISCVTDAEKNGFDSETGTTQVTKRDVAPPAD